MIKFGNLTFVPYAPKTGETRVPPSPRIDALDYRNGGWQLKGSSQIGSEHAI